MGGGRAPPRWPEPHPETPSWAAVISNTFSLQTALETVAGQPGTERSADLDEKAFNSWLETE